MGAISDSTAIKGKKCHRPSLWAGLEEALASPVSIFTWELGGHCVCPHLEKLSSEIKI